VGQWVRARIYERRCDLSPEGKWFIYFSMNGRWNSETRGSWTAISRAPYLKAIALFAKGDCWNGGGLFTKEQRYWLNDGYGHTALRDDSRLRRDLKFRPLDHYGNECTGIYYLRLQRDGWTLKKHDRSERLNALAVFEKPAAAGWVLRKFAHEQIGAPPGNGCYWDEHELQHMESGLRIPAKDWQWADMDGKRVVWAANGELWAGYLKTEGLSNARCLHDFNDMKFEAIAAPY